jgi:hypothetical protein
MKRIAFLFFLSLFYGLSITAQGGALKQANDLYSKGNFEAAAKKYELIVEHQGVATQLYYNLGNAYYKSNEIGRSILNFERALRLNPSFDDARYNLDIAQLKVVDNIVQAPTFFLGRWTENLIKLVSSNQWLFMSLTFFVLFLVAVFLFVFGNSRRIRKISFYAGIVLLGFTFTSFIFSGVRKNQLGTHNHAIIMSGVVTVKSSPDKSGTDLFQLHEGTKVSLKSTLGDWIEIRLGNGSIGWVKQECLEKI